MHKPAATLIKAWQRFYFQPTEYNGAVAEKAKDDYFTEWFNHQEAKGLNAKEIKAKKQLFDKEFTRIAQSAEHIKDYWPLLADE